MSERKWTKGVAGVDVVAVLEGASFMYRSHGMIDQAHGADLAKCEFLRMKERHDSLIAKASDEQVQEWAERHDIFCGGSGAHLSDARSALEDAQSICALQRAEGKSND